MITKKNTTLRTYLRYLVPSMFGMVLMAVYTFTDTFVVGQKLGAIALGAMGICTPVVTITFALGFLFGIGGGALYSISMGKKDKEHANQVFSTSMFLMLIVGVIIAVFGNIFIYNMAYFLGADSNNIEYVIPYLRCILVYIPGFMLDIFMMSYMKNDGHPSVAMMATVVGTILNVVLDLLFVFIFGWGMFGAAIATCIGSGVSTCINILYSLIKKMNIRFFIKNIRPKLMLHIVKNGMSVFILECSSGIVTFIFIMLAIKFYGTIGSSIYTIIMNWTLICFNLIMGIGQSVQPLISVSFGANDYKKVKIYRKYAIISSIIAGIIFIIIGYGCTDALVSVFASDSEELITKTVECFRYYLPAYAIMGIGISIGIYFQSIGSALKSLIIMLSRGIVLPVVGAFALSAWLGPKGLWISVPCAETITTITAIFFLIFLNKKVNVTETQKSKEIIDNLHVIVTISREFGSGGHEIGRELAAKLGVPVYDKEVGVFTETQSGFSSDVIDSEEDKDIYPFGLFNRNHYTPITGQIFLAQCKVIEDLAAKGSCVIVGRCADYVLNGIYPLVSVFVHAPVEMRAKRIIEYDRCSEKEALQKIEESDKARSGYHNFYIGTEWGKSLNYDITVNSNLGISVVTNALYKIVTQKYPEIKTRNVNSSEVNTHEVKAIN